MVNSFYSISPINNTIAKNTNILLARVITLGGLFILFPLMFSFFYFILFYPLVSTCILCPILLLNFYQTWKKDTSIKKIEANSLEGLRNNDPIIIEYIYNGQIGNQIRKMVRESGGDQNEAEDILIFSMKKAIYIVNNESDFELEGISNFLMSIAISTMKDKGKNPFDNITNVFSDRNVKEIDSLNEEHSVFNYITTRNPKCRGFLFERYIKGVKLNEIGTAQDIAKVCIQELRALIF